MLLNPFGKIQAGRFEYTESERNNSVAMVSEGRIDTGDAPAA